MQRKNMLVAALTILLLATSPAFAQKKPARNAAGSDEIKTVLQKLYAAWSELDPTKAAPFYAKDADLMFFDIAPLKYNGWSEYAEGVPKAFAAYRSGKFTLNDDLRTHRHGNWAWASATWHAELIKNDGSKENPEGRYTAVLEKRGQQWLVVHEHMSLPAH